ncbi:hypothetical protein ACGFZS_43405 [Streptomyces sp. NPDC048288]|uniref:hypothetical protein n=1 Tax=Streptomyces sp. NPDC048288 TaxID=3365529 RepID=UPI0037148B32
MTLDQNTADKAPGDPVRSADWNDLAAAVLRHETGKLDLTGGTVTGLLTAQGGLTAPQSLGVQLLTPEQASFDNITVSEVKMINRDVPFQTDTTLLLVGHGHGTTADVNHPLTMRIKVDGVTTGTFDGEGVEWGRGYLAASKDTWLPITAIGTTRVLAGTRNLQLTASGGAPEAMASLHEPALWVIRLGAG